MEVSIIQSIVLGIVQGVTEFLPISSSGHIVLAEYLFGIENPGVEFVVALHVGSVFAVIAYFWRDWLNLFRIKNDMEMYQKNKNLLWFVVVATLPAALVGIVLSDFSEVLIFPPTVVAFLIVIGSLIIYLSDRYFSTKKEMYNMKFSNAFVIGLAQVFSLIPGISRSGMTISAARLCCLNRVDAARFSFLIATPIVAGAGFFQVGSISLESIDKSVVAGAITSFVAAILTIHYFLALIKKISYAFFLYYAIGFFILIVIVLG